MPAQPVEDTEMTNSEIFSLAHDLTKGLVTEGISYRATFGLVLKMVRRAVSHAAWGPVLDTRQVIKKLATAGELATLPTIVGVSEKQIAYATKMRGQRFTNALGWVNRLREILDDTEDQKALDVVERELRNNSDAKFWLDVVGEHVNEETIGRIYHHAVAA
ncbi:hypothetical protein [Aurantimonas coralicida]|uniref:hypothetical protein n=1 Tax=Aurantimonas coralicida TaxID=182270 RepID=UPI0012DC4AD6|nr:hypothetical protein [Aurantimonas coralicida]